MYKRKKTMTQQMIKQLFSRFKAHNPAPTTELLYSSDFELLIAVMLSAQSTDVSVNKATKTLFAAAACPQSMLALGLETIKQHIRHLGLFNAKAKHIMATCQILIDLHQSQVPRERSALEALPGVGRKTANVILNTAFGLPTLAVDTHIFRVAHRLGLATGKTPLQVERQLLCVIPSTYLKDAHHWLILHGRYTCIARKPACYRCIIADLCPHPEKTQQ